VLLIALCLLYADPPPVSDLRFSTWYTYCIAVENTFPPQSLAPQPQGLCLFAASIKAGSGISKEKRNADLNSAGVRFAAP